MPYTLKKHIDAAQKLFAHAPKGQIGYTTYQSVFAVLWSCDQVPQYDSIKHSFKCQGGSEGGLLMSALSGFLSEVCAPHITGQSKGFYDAYHKEPPHSSLFVWCEDLYQQGAAIIAERVARSAVIAGRPRSSSLPINASSSTSSPPSSETARALTPPRASSSSVFAESPKPPRVSGAISAGAVALPGLARLD